MLEANPAQLKHSWTPAITWDISFLSTTFVPCSRTPGVAVTMWVTVKSGEANTEPSSGRNVFSTRTPTVETQGLA